MTESDLLDALAKATQPTKTDDAGSTIAELALRLYGYDSSGTRAKVTKRLQQLKTDGRLKVGRRRVERLSGGMYPIAVFSMMKAKR